MSDKTTPEEWDTIAEMAEWIKSDPERNSAALDWWDHAIARVEGLETRIKALRRAVKKMHRMARLSEHDDQDTMEARLQGIERAAHAALWEVTK